MQSYITVGEAESGAELTIDLTHLIESRMLIQANSGGGKSWAIRRILEQSHGKHQQLVIDVEDEFNTLREKYDYVLAGARAADVPADCRSAGILARRLLELGTSAIIGIYELKAHERIRFVRLFLESLMNAPKDLWHPVIVVVDEAHIFAPQHNEAESASAVIDLMTRGRKRGFCGILATQRISKLHKDAAAEANNKLIGRSSLDVDMKRAGDELGFTNRTEILNLRGLPPGEFFAFGPSFKFQNVTKCKIGPVLTSHPRAGERAVMPPAPRDAIKKLLAHLADLPREAEKEAQTVESLNRKIRELQTEANRNSKFIDPMEISILKAKVSARDKFIGRLRALLSSANFRTQKIHDLAVIEEIPAFDEPGITAMETKSPTPAPVPRAPIVKAQPQRDHAASEDDSFSDGVGIGPKKIMIALAQFGDLSKRAIGIYTIYKITGGTFNTYLSRLRQRNFIEQNGETFRITDEGKRALGSYEPLPMGSELFEIWCAHVGSDHCMAKVLRVLREALPRAMNKDQIGEAVGMIASGGTFNTYLSRLRTLNLISGKGDLKLADELTDF